MSEHGWLLFSAGGSGNMFPDNETWAQAFELAASHVAATARDETFICPECGTEMIRSPLDANFLIHVESTDCAPEPWPTPEEARQ